MALTGTLAPRLARPQHVQAHARHDGGKPRPGVLYAVRVGAGQPQPRLLYRVVGFTSRAEHAVGHRKQMVSVRLEIVHGYLSARPSVIALTSEDEHK